MLLSNIKTTTIIVPANEQEYTDVMTLLEFGGYKQFGRVDYNKFPVLIALYFSRQYIALVSDLFSLDKLPKLTAHEFIKSNTTAIEN